MSSTAEVTFILAITGDTNLKGILNSCSGQNFIASLESAECICILFNTIKIFKMY